MTVAWEFTGEYVESCNSEVLCPGLLSRAQARPAEGHRDVGHYAPIRWSNA